MGNQGTLTQIMLSICPLIRKTSAKQPSLTAGFLDLRTIDTRARMTVVRAVLCIQVVQQPLPSRC